MLAITFDPPTLITTGAIIVLAMILGYRLLNRDPSVRRTRWGIFMERDHYDEESEVWTVDPLDPESETRPAPIPPPTPPPPLPRPEDEDTKITWPTKED